MKTLHHLQIITFLFISITLLAWSGIYIYSELMQQIPQRTMDSWECNGKIDLEENWNRQQAIMSQIYPFLEFDVQANTNIARLYEWQAIGNEAWSDSAINARQQSIEYYREVIKLRPVWATGWLNLVKSKSLNQQFDDEVLAAFSNAFYFGRNQTGIQSQIIWLALGMWDSLDAVNQDNLRLLIRDLLNLKKKEYFILITAFRFNWVQELKTLSSNTDFLKRISYFENNQDALEKALNPQAANTVCPQ